MSQKPGSGRQNVENRVLSPQPPLDEELKAETEDNAVSPVSQERTAWLQVVGAFSLNMNTWGLMNAFGSWQTFYQLDLLRSYSAFSISWIGSLQAALLFFVSLLAGAVFDAGYARPMLAVGTLFTVLGIFMTSLCHAYWQCILAQGLTMGLGFGCIYLPAPAIVSQHFDKHRALAIGTSSAGSAIGGVLYAVVFSRVQATSSFGWATRAVAFIVLATSILPLLFMRSRHVTTSAPRLFDRTAFFDVPYMLLNLGLLFGFMGLYIIFYYVQLYAITEIDASSPVVEYLLTILNATSLLGRVVAGFYADKIGSINMQAAVALISALLTYCLIAIKNIPGLIVFCLLYGASAGAFQGLPAAGIATLCDDPSAIGIRIGMTLAFVGVGVLVSNPIAGAILGPINGRDVGDWTGLIMWCAVLLTASGVCMIAARTARVGVNFKAI